MHTTPRQADPPPAGRPPRQADPPGRQTPPLGTVNARPVRILLEYILVYLIFHAAMDSLVLLRLYHF